MKSNEITLGGILTALTIVILYLAAILPVSTISILTISAAIVAVCIIRSNIKTAAFVYIASSIIGFFIIPLNIWLLYILIFGGYSIIKYLIERIRKEYIEYLLKFSYFNIIFILSILLAKIVLAVDVFKLARDMIDRYITIEGNFLVVALFWITSQIVLFLFDYGLTLIITFYMDRIHKRY